MAAHKREGPTTCLTFLGIEVDTLNGQLRLPADKLARLTATVNEWGARRACTHRHLQSLIGLLNHACKVVRPGRCFLRRMINLLQSFCPSSPNSAIIRLNTAFRADLAWWQEFIKDWNGVSFLSTEFHNSHLAMTSDASGSWGCGAWHSVHWFQVPWDLRSESMSIAEKELIPIILGAAIWGRNCMEGSKGIMLL